MGDDQRFIAAVNVDRVVEQDVHVNAPRTKADLMPIMPWRESWEREGEAFNARGRGREGGEGEREEITYPSGRASKSLFDALDQVEQLAGCELRSDLGFVTREVLGHL